jgi:hypothetical protein
MPALTQLPSSPAAPSLRSDTGSASTIANNIGKYYGWAITSDAASNKFWPLPGNHVRRGCLLALLASGQVLMRLRCCPRLRLQRQTPALRQFFRGPATSGAAGMCIVALFNTACCMPPCRAPAQSRHRFCAASQDWGNTCPCPACLNPYLNYFKVLANQRYYARQARAPSPAPRLPPAGAGRAWRAALGASRGPPVGRRGVARMSAQWFP